MFVNTTMSGNMRNTLLNSTLFANQSSVYSEVSDILNCAGVLFALVGVVFGCFVINIVRKLNDDELRSRFSLLCVLICDVIMAFSNLSAVGSIFTLIDRRRFEPLKCPFLYFNWILSSLFVIPLDLSLLCLAVDQVFAVFKPLYFRTRAGTRQKVIYAIITFVPVPLILCILIYWTFAITDNSDDELDCSLMVEADSALSQCVLVLIVPVAFSIPLIYAVVLWKISRQRDVHSENPVENIKNRRLVVTFLFISASYFLLWIPTLAYFSVCYYSDDGCWHEDAFDMSIVVQVIFTLNYVVDPIICALRMEPIKQRIRVMLKKR